MANFEQDFFAALDKLEVDAKAVGLNLTSICKETGVSRATPGRWRREVPMTVQLLKQMQAVVAKKEAAGVGSDLQGLMNQAITQKAAGAAQK